APTAALRAAAVALPFVAIAQVILGGSRGLKIMRDTLVAYWVGQPISWIVFSLIAWTFSKTVTATVATYGLSWLFATAVAWVMWHRDTGGLDHQPAEPGEVNALMRYGAPRAPAALLSQALFYTDFFVLSANTAGPSLGVYAASVRVAQALVLFLTAVSYMFSPFVADLHERGERDRLNVLFKAITRWTLAGTIPLLLLFMVAPGPILQVFGAKFQTGTSWLRILLVGQILNVSVGAAGFVLIMAGRTGWDLIVYASSFLLDLGMSLVLVPRFGPTGAAVAQASTLAASNAFRLFLVWRFVHIQPYDRHYARLAIPAAAATAVMLGVHGVLASKAWPVDLFGTGLVGGVAYLVVLVAAGLTPVEKRTILRVARRRPVAPSDEGSPLNG
ncbi:MAG TPA: polysaccharide biosynthesis C-terminal domain-containing protein, partial [Actinomycetota bacterium]|nr:polysaccharide biosynthesis C-terminal domain-containing protein [Actinomycetota bacterium]